MLKEPWLAVNFSMFVPGWGQVYGGKGLRGLFWFLAIVGLAIGSFWSLLSPKGEIITSLILAIAGTLLHIINIFDAHQVIYRQRNDKKLEKIPRTHKNAWFAVFASRIIPGLGHIYSRSVFTGYFSI
jgi:signal peptidase I